jgi:hypothetical protein
MENQRIKYLQSFVGKQFTGSPSPFAHWLKGKVISAEEKSVAFQFMVRKDILPRRGRTYTGRLEKYGQT